jgi:hypothetical protein
MGIGNVGVNASQLPRRASDVGTGENHSEKEVIRDFSKYNPSAGIGDRIRRAGLARGEFSDDRPPP